MLKMLFLTLVLAFFANVQGEQTLALIKPDGVANHHIGDILSKLEKSGFTLKGIKLTRLTPTQAGEFYAVHKGKPFYNDLVSYMSSGPIVAIVLDKDQAISEYRTLMGTTDPKTAAPGTLRAEFAESKGRNTVHGSDSPEAAKTEIAFFFQPNELF